MEHENGHPANAIDFGEFKVNVIRGPQRLYVRIDPALGFDFIEAGEHFIDKDGKRGTELVIGPEVHEA